MNLELDNANMRTSQAEAEVKMLVENSDKTEIIQQLSMIKIDLSNSEAQLNKERTERYNLAKENKYFRRTISKLVKVIEQDKITVRSLEQQNYSSSIHKRKMQLAGQEELKRIKNELNSIGNTDTESMNP